MHCDQENSLSTDKSVETKFSYGPDVHFGFVKLGLDESHLKKEGVGLDDVFL